MALLAVALLPAIALALSPPPPSDLQVVSGAKPAIAVLSWTASPDDSVEGYRVYIATAADGPYTLAESVGETTFTFTDGIGGIGYYFQVTAVTVDGLGVTEESTPVQAGPVSAAWLASPHVVFDRSTTACSKCHGVHQGMTALLLHDGMETLAPDPAGTCYTCHGGQSATASNIEGGTEDSFALSSGHTMEGAADGGLTENCSSCHQMHEATDTSPGLPRRVINGANVGTNGSTWCYSCHDESNSWYEGTYPDLESPQRNATGYPVSGTWPGEEAYGSTWNAHRLIPESTQTVEAGGGGTHRARGDCLYCHSAHRGPSKYDGLRATFGPATASTLASDQADGTYAALCFTCHGTVTPSGFATATVDIKNIKQFATAAGSNAGHRIKSPDGLLPVGAPLPCYECHGPHGSTRGNESLISDVLGKNLNTASASNVRKFCFTCHTTADTGKGWDGEGGYSQPGSDPDDLVVGLRRDDTATVLRLPLTLGHDQADETSCYACHGDDYGPGGANVHNPGAGPNHVAETAESQDCAVCHDSLSVIEVHDFGGCETCHGEPDLSAGKTAECASCHVDKLTPHGYEAVQHTATLGSGSVALFENHDGWMGATGVSVGCGECHSDELGPVHANVCSTCHPTPRDSFTAWNGDCTQGGCHATYHASGFDHGEIASGNCGVCHDEGAFDLYSDPCVGCHAPPDPGDSTAPVTTTNVLTTYTGTAHVDFQVTDSGTVAIARTLRRLDGGPVMMGDSFEVTEPGDHTLEYWSVDQYGNVESPSTRSFTVALDTTPPVTTSDALLAYVGPATIRLSATDASTLGVKGTYYRLNGGATVMGTTIAISQPASGTVGYILEYWSDDYSGNVEAHNVVGFTVTRDVVAPVSTLNAQPYYRGPTVSIPYTATDSGSGVQYRYYRIDGGSVQNLGPASGNNVTRTFATQGLHTIEYWAADRVSNAEAHRFASFVVDWTPPTVSSNALAAYPETGANITITAVDEPADGAGPPTVFYRLDGGSEITTEAVATASVSTVGFHLLEFWAVDLAGNATAHSAVGFAVGTAPEPSGFGTLRLIWGGTGNPPPYSWADWTVRDGSETGPIVGAGFGDSGPSGSDWDGIDDVAVPAQVDPYWVGITWYDDYWPEFGTPTTIHFPVYVTVDGQIVELAY